MISQTLKQKTSILTMKTLSRASILIFNMNSMIITTIILLLIVASESHPTRSHGGGREIPKNFWPWDHHNHHMCTPFWPFACDPAESPPLPSPSPPLPPPAVVTPAIALPPIIPSLPTGLIFADLRLALVYPIIQNFKSIITSDPLGITNTWVGSDICSYKGFFCDAPPHNASATSIASIDFNGYGLAAPTLDGFVDQFPDLALFHANSNNFGGIVSPNIAKLPYLYELDLSNNKFSGSFPQAVVGMESLTFLDIRFNLFTGSVPAAIFAQNLDVLFLNDNLFLSTLPDSLGATHILYLTLANNKFIGPLPRDIAKALTGLTEVLLLNNQLSGCLPYELGFLNQVTVFDVSNNLLTGPIPFSLACLETVQLLDFSSNLLYGMVPDLICQLPNLVNLSLSNNYFTQVGPVCRNLIRKGVLDVRNNCIPGLSFQRSILECTPFFAVPKLCPYMETFTIIPCKPSFP